MNINVSPSILTSVWPVLQYAVANRDGTRINRWRRQVTITGSERSVTGSTTQFETKLLIADDGIVRFQYKPREDAEFIRMQVGMG